MSRYALPRRSFTITTRTPLRKEARIIGNGFQLLFDIGIARSVAQKNFIKILENILGIKGHLFPINNHTPSITVLFARIEAKTGSFYVKPQRTKKLMQ